MFERGGVGMCVVRVLGLRLFRVVLRGGDEKKTDNTHFEGDVVKEQVERKSCTRTCHVGGLARKREERREK